MKISLIASTYNWKEALELVLLSVLHQTRPPDELIIADDGSGDDTRALIETLLPQFSMPVKHLWQEDKGFRRCTILNKSITEATGDYIIQVDGDVILHPEFIADHERFAAPKRFIRGYRVRLGESYSEGVFARKQITFPQFVNGIAHAHKTVRMPLLSHLVRWDRLRYNRVYGCNMSYWRADAVAANGYNEDISGWGCEDEEFVARLTFNGVKRRKVRFAAKQYHLYHPETSQDRLSINQSILKKTIAERAPVCAHGIRKIEVTQ